MRGFSIFRKAPQARIAEASNTLKSQHLAPAGGYGMRVALSISAAGLVISSAGFGAVYAYTASASHGPVLAGLAVLMSVALEVAKPYSLEAAFGCFRRWAMVRGLAMLALATVAIGYSLVAELSLMAQTRGDSSATREAAADARGKAAARYQRAAAELAALPPSRTPGELAALLGGKDCDVPTKSTKALCAEMARAERRAELETALSKAEADTVTRHAVGTGDAGAASLAALLGLFGVTIAPGLLATILVLVGVVALESGSSLAVVLCKAMGGDGKSRKICDIKFLVNENFEPGAMGDGKSSRNEKPNSRRVPHGEEPSRGNIVTPAGEGFAKCETLSPSRKRGRPPLGSVAMTPAERQRKFRDRQTSGTLN